MEPDQMTYKQQTRIFSWQVKDFFRKVDLQVKATGVRMNHIGLAGGTIFSRVTFEIAGPEYNVRQFMLDWHLYD